MTLHLHKVFLSQRSSLSLSQSPLPALFLACILNVICLQESVLSSLSTFSLGDVTYSLSFTYHEYVDHSHSKFPNPIYTMHMGVSLYPKTTEHSYAWPQALQAHSVKANFSSFLPSLPPVVPPVKFCNEVFPKMYYFPENLGF